MARTWRAEVEIDATPARVWAVLVDFPAYARWNPFTIEVSTNGSLGAPVRMRVNLGGATPVVQKETLVAYEAPRRLAWALDRPPRWLLWALREQRLTDLGDGRTRYVTEDTIGGLLGPVVALTYGRALTAGFDAMAAALKLEVESARG